MARSSDNQTGDWHSYRCVRPIQTSIAGNRGCKDKLTRWRDTLPPVSLRMRSFLLASQGEMEQLDRSQRLALCACLFIACFRMGPQHVEGGSCVVEKT